MDSINLKSFFDFLVDAAPFVLYAAVLHKLYKSWVKIKQMSDVVRKHTLVPVIMIMALVSGIALASNIYALVAYGQTYMSLRVFQLFLAGNCAAYWLMLDIIVKDAAPHEEGSLSEPANRTQ